MDVVRCKVEEATDFGVPVGLMFSPDGRWLVAGDETGNMAIFISSSGEPVWAWCCSFELGPEGGALIETLVAFSSDGRRAALANSLGQVSLITLDDDGCRDFGRQIFSSRGTSDEVLRMEFSPDGKFLLVCWVDAGVSVWGLEDEPEELWATSAAFWWGRFSSDGRYVYCGGPDEYVRKRHVLNARAELRFSLVSDDDSDDFPNDGLLHGSVSADGRYLLTQPAESDRVLLWDNRTGDLLRFFGCEEDLVDGQFVNVMSARFAFGPEGELLVLTASSMFEDPRQVVSVWTQFDCWRFEDGKKLGSYRVFSRDIDTYGLLGDGSVALLHENGALHIFDLISMSGRRLVLHGRTVNFLALEDCPGTVCRLLEDHNGTYEVSTSSLRGERRRWCTRPVLDSRANSIAETVFVAVINGDGQLLTALVDPPHEEGERGDIRLFRIFPFEVPVR